jgi:hypothetical protein
VHNPAPTSSGTSSTFNMSQTEGEMHGRGGTYVVTNNVLVWGMNLDSSIGETIVTYNWPQAYEHASWQQNGHYQMPYFENGHFPSARSSVSASVGSGASAISIQDVEMTGSAI